MMQPTEKRIVFVLGAPGAGKGTLCKLISAELKLNHTSIGDLLRQVVSSPDVDKAVIECVQRGELVSTEHLFSILKPHVESDPRPVVLLDGFPRRLDQAERFEKAFGEALLVLFFDCPEALAETRVVTRLDGRAGDNLETFRKRYKEFLELNPPILEYFEKKGKLVTINTSGETESSYGNLMNALRSRCEWGDLISQE